MCGLGKEMNEGWRGGLGLGKEMNKGWRGGLGLGKEMNEGEGVVWFGVNKVRSVREKEGVWSKKVRVRCFFLMKI